jgi:hypothetical protein
MGVWWTECGGDGVSHLFGSSTKKGDDEKTHKTTHTYTHVHTHTHTKKIKNKNCFGGPSDGAEVSFLELAVRSLELEYMNLPRSSDIRNDHTNMTAPLPVCSAKLSMFGPS